MKPLLDLRRVVKEFPVTTRPFARSRALMLSAVADVSVQVAAGETVGIVGESGCGKTTLSRLIVGLERPTSGEIWFDGRDVTAGRGRARLERAAEMQLMFQDSHSALDPRTTIGATIQEPLDIHRTGTRAERRERVRELLSEVGLSSQMAQRYPHELSGGQRQRVGLARALSLRPRLIVADEPVSALDVSVQAQILNLINTLQERHGLTVILISHDLSVVRYVADRVGVMYLGKLVELGATESIFSAPAMPYTAGLLSASPPPDPTAETRRDWRLPLGEPPSPIEPPSGCRYRTRCPYAREQCSAEEPQLRPVDRGQLAACHFPLKRSVDSGAPESRDCGA